MNKYTKVVSIMGTYYTKEFEKIKHHKNKVREVNEDTVIKAFKNGNTEITVFFEETDKIMIIDDFSPPEDIKKFLGKKFL